MEYYKLKVHIICEFMTKLGEHWYYVSNIKHSFLNQSIMLVLYNIKDRM